MFLMQIHFGWKMELFLLQDLLALGELIGNVSTGLPEETIDRQLKTRTWASSLFINLEELPCEDHDAASCIICQVKIGSFLLNQLSRFISSI